MTNIITYGTFDVFHYGHYLLLERAANLGDMLTVGVSTDEFNRSKGKHSELSYETRARMVSQLRFVDLVIPEVGWDQKLEDIRRHEIDIFVMGDDWQGEFDHLAADCKVVYLERTPGISSTFIRAK